MSARELKKSAGFLMLVVIFLGLNSKDGRASSPSPLELLSVDSVFTEARDHFDQYALEFYHEINDPNLSYEPFYQGLVGYHNLINRGELPKDHVLTIIDFTKPSYDKRLFIIDMCDRKVIHTSLVSHGQMSGGLYARKFSNDENSHQSSLGFYVTTSTYTGKFKLALRLEGMEYSNSHAASRGVVMHGADYASPEFLEGNGCVLGRSYGCPALPHEGFEQVVEWIKEGTCLFIYYPNKSYQRHSKYLNRRNYLEEFVEI